MLRDEDIELVKSQVNMRILAEHFGIHVNRAGQALCPFHSDKRPSMKVHSGYLDHDGYYCWSCGAGGTIFGFVMDYCGLNFEASVKYIAGTFGISISEETKLLKADKEKIHHQKRMREVYREIDGAGQAALRILSEKIWLFEEIQRAVTPFGDLFCWVSNRIPLLKDQWEELFDAIYSKNGGG